MDNFKRFAYQVKTRIFIYMLISSFVLLGLLYGILVFGKAPLAIAFPCVALASLALSYLFAQTATDDTTAPVKYIWQAVLHVSPDHHGTPAPNLDRLKLGRQLVNTLILQIYQFASHESGKNTAEIEHRKQVIQATNVVSHMPLPIYVLNKDLQVIHASNAGIEYSGKESSKLFGKPLVESLNLQFANEFTLETWIAQCQNNKITDTAYWERVRVVSSDNQTLRQCDISAHYDRDNQSGADFIITIFDRTEQYNEDDQSMSFIALAVHELRTPLTMLRGYIELFKEELDDKLDDEMRKFMLKMESSANQLTAFVHNILNVSKVEADQLELHLIEEDWADIIHKGAADMISRAEILGIKIEFDISDDLPKAAADRLSIYEVINNLLDNAIKYSNGSKKIIIRAKLNKSGMIETTVQDFGSGIPESVLPNLFEKFYRSHRTKSNVAGTGLGLYLIKCLITAHGGQVWASSKEEQGSTFGFTIIPYGRLAEEQKSSHNNEITRHAHGWIKNHSIYRR